MKKQQATLIFGATIVLSILMHWSIFDKDITGLHSWRQSQTQWNIRNFYRHDGNILNPRVSNHNGGKDNLYRYEFPIMQWTIAMIQKVFGESILVTRICIFMLGIFSLWAFYYLLKVLDFSSLMASIGTWTFNFSPVFYYYTVNPIPDNLALVSGLWYLYFFIKFTQSKSLKHCIIAAFFLSLATLAKLPFIILGGATFVYFLHHFYLYKFQNFKPLLSQIACYLLLILPAAAWYAWVMPTWNNGVVTGVFDNQISFLELVKILHFHIIEMFPKILMNPACWFFFVLAIYLFFKEKIYRRNNVSYLCGSLFFVMLYFVLEINMINIAHDYYMMPFLPFLFILIAYGIHKTWQFHPYAKFFVIASLLAMPYFCAQKNRDSWKPEKAALNVDLFTHQEALKNAVPYSEKCIILNDYTHFLFSYLIDKQGHIFANDHLPTFWIREMIRNDKVKYMYSDSRKIDGQTDVQLLIKNTILEAGTVKVFELKSAEELKAQGIVD